MRIFTGLLSCLIALNSIPVWADQTAVYEQCAIDLCGPASNYARILARGSFGNANNESKSFINDKLDPILDEAFAVALKNKSLSAAYADKNIKTANLAMSDEQRAFLTTLTYMTSLSKFLVEIIKSSDGRTYQIDKEKLRVKLPNLTAQQVDSYTTVMNTLFSNYSFQTALSLDGASYDNLIQSWGVLADYNIQNLKSSLTNLFAVLGSGIKAVVNPEVIDKALQDKNSLTDSEKKRFISTMGVIYRGQGMTDPSVIAVTKPINIQLSDAANMLNWSDKNIKIQQTLASKSLIASSKNDVRKQCHEAWSQSLATAPSELRQRQSDKLLSQVKLSGKKILPKYFSNDALALANVAVDKMTFTKPLNLPQIQNQLVDTLSDTLKKGKSFESELASASSLDSVGYTIMSLSGPVEDDFNIFDGIQDACKKMAPRNFVDAAYQRNNSIVTSWQSTMFPEIGVGVLAHELGHIVSYSVGSSSEANREGYSKARVCSIEKHARLAQDPIVGKYNQFAEEDWADVFAADVLLDLEKSWPYSTNYACGLIDLEEKEAK